MASRACFSTSISSHPATGAVAAPKRAGAFWGKVCGRRCQPGAGALPALTCQPLMPTPEDTLLSLSGQQGAIPNHLLSSPPSPPSYLRLSKAPSPPPLPALALHGSSLIYQLRQRLGSRGTASARRGTWGCGELETPRVFIWLPFCGFRKVPAGLQQKLLRDGPRPVPVSSAGPAGAAQAPRCRVCVPACV